MSWFVTSWDMQTTTWWTSVGFFHSFLCIYQVGWRKPSVFNPCLPLKVRLFPVSKSRSKPPESPSFWVFFGCPGQVKLGHWQDDGPCEVRDRQHGRLGDQRRREGGTKAYKNPFTQHIIYIYIYIIIVYDWYTWYDYNNYVLGFHTI